MNRQNDLSEMITKSFIEATEKMSDDDKLSFYQAKLDGDKKTESEILKKYNYMVVKPIENAMSDEDATSLANYFLKDSKGIFNEINNMLALSTKQYWLEKPRMCEIPLDQHKKILEHARDLQTSFDSKKNVNSILHAFYGENTTNILKAAFIADVVGCMDLRNDLMILFSSMIEGAYLDKTSSIVNSNLMKSKEQSDRASKPRNPYYSEVMEVIRLTWESYPKGSPTKLLNELSKHYENKVSRNSLSNWISGSGLKPLKPEKYTDLKLVFPQ